MDRLKQLLSDGLSFLQALAFPMGRSLRENAGLAAISIVLGVALWIFVTDEQDVTRSGVLPFDLEVEPVNVPPDLATAGSPVNVRVRVDVADDVWPTLSPTDFEATVDLDDLQAGTYDLPVRAEAQTGRGGLRVTQVIPENVTVELKSLFSKSVPIRVNMEGSVPPGFETSVPELEADTVLVTGTQDRVMLVTQAVASLDLGGRTESVEQAVRLEPRDSRGFLVEGVSLEPGVVNVSVKIEQTQLSRALVISPTVTGTAAAGYNVVSVTVEPAVATAFGPESFVGEAANLETQPVDISGATDDVVRTVSLDLPPEVSVSGGTTVTVTAQIEPAVGSRTMGVTTVAVGLAPDLSIEGALPLVEVTLLGELPELQGLRPNDIAATINLTELEEGKHTVNVSVSAPSDAEVASVSPDEVEVTLEAR